MKWHENLALVLGFGGLFQLIKWILDSLGVKPSGETLTFFLAGLFSLQILIILLLIQVQEENKKMKEFLKKQGLKENMSLINNLIKNNKGSFDARVLLLFVAFIILYLLYKIYTS